MCQEWFLYFVKCGFSGARHWIPCATLYSLCRRIDSSVASLVRLRRQHKHLNTMIELIAAIRNVFVEGNFAEMETTYPNGCRCVILVVRSGDGEYGICKHWLVKQWPYELSRVHVDCHCGPVDQIPSCMHLRWSRPMRKKKQFHRLVSRSFNVERFILSVRQHSLCTRRNSR